MKILLLFLIFIAGCNIPRVDGLYINNTLVIKDATVEQFCKASGNKELIRNNKVRLSKGD